MSAQLKPIGMTAEEARAFSIVNLMRAMVDEQWGARHAGLELAACRATADEYKVDRAGFFLPPDIQKRVLTATGGVSSGGAVVETEVGEAWYAHALTAAAKVINMGATVLTASNSVAIPRVQPGTNVAAVGENSAGSASDETFALVTYKPNTLTSNVTVSRRLLAVTGNFAETVVRNDLIEAMAIAVDFYAVQGSGSGGQPLGLLNTSGISVIALGTNGGNPTYANLVSVEKQVSLQNGITQSLKMGWLTNTKARALLRVTSKQTNWGFLWDDAPQPEYDGWIMGYPACVSNNVPSTLTKGTSSGNCSALIFGNWADLYILQFSPVGIVVDPYTFSNTGAIKYNVFQEVDIQPRRTDSFTQILDITAP